MKKYILLFSLVLLLFSGCTNNNQEEFDQDKIDIELFEHLTSEGIQTAEKEELIGRANDITVLANIHVGVLNNTGIYNYKEEKLLNYVTVFELLDWCEGVNYSVAEEGSFDATDLDIVEGTVKYLKSEDAQKCSQLLYGVDFQGENYKKGLYSEELDGYFEMTGFGGVYSGRLNGNPEVLKYKDTYVVKDSVYSSQFSKVIGTHHSVMKKVDGRFVFSWSYTSLDK